ncbi:MAG: ABC transporter permease [Candidatus Omnitrophica bacterium]|nr:ABC transporter permease [Candidatus Omnitrophota bacterium]
MIAIIKEILTRKNLIGELVLKDLKLRYGRPILGPFWAFLLPLTTVFIFYLVFSVFLKAKTEEVPYVLYLMSAIFPWRFFNDSITCSATCLVDNKNLIRESNFPYYFLPLSIVLANLINFLPSLAVLIFTAFFLLKGLPLLIILLPLLLLVQLLMTIGLSIIFSLLYVKYRDLKYILEITLTVSFYLTPVFYSLYLVKNSLAPVLFKAYLYNPLTGILIFYRSVILKGFYLFIAKDLGWLFSISLVACFSLGVLFLGFYCYLRFKDKVHDYLSC